MEKVRLCETAAKKTTFFSHNENSYSTVYPMKQDVPVKVYTD